MAIENKMVEKSEIFKESKILEESSMLNRRFLNKVFSRPLHIDYKAKVLCTCGETTDIDREFGIMKRNYSLTTKVVCDSCYGVIPIVYNIECSSYVVYATIAQENNKQ